MNNTERRQLCYDFVLPMVAIKQMPSLDPVMASQCSISTKTSDKVLALIHSLVLDMIIQSVGGRGIIIMLLPIIVVEDKN